MGTSSRAISFIRFSMRLEVLGREGLVPEEVVVEAGLDGRADAGLGPGIEIQDGVGQEVGRAVSQDVDRTMFIVAHALCQFLGAGEPNQAGTTDRCILTA